LYNQLTWTRSSSTGVTGYAIYRDGIKIATLKSSSSLYRDHNRPRGGTAVYTVVAFDASGTTSVPATVTVP
jgi:Tfp pilus assembly protein PilX